jgi:diketogulonate reductase-like aldo/keto reductase
VRDAVAWALEAGYRHVDTAAMYGNETGVGQAVRESGLARDEIFVTTKLWNRDHGYDRALRAFDASLERLDMERVDLYLVHWPVEGLRLESWRALERILEEGRARAIGVSNYMVRHLEELLAHAHVPPAVNQIELHPFNWRSRRSVLELCREQEIVVEAYSPLTKAMNLDEPVVGEVARELERTPAQVLIRYALEKGTVALPKSGDRERIRENGRVFDFGLDEGQLARLDALDRGLAVSWDPTDAP